MQCGRWWSCPRIGWGQVFLYHIRDAIVHPIMARPLRLELAGALYHVTSRGDGREDIFLSDDDREVWLETLAEVCERFNWVCHAYCQMTNHVQGERGEV